LHVDFRKVEPPPGRQPEAEKGEETIRVDEATRAGRDLEIANQVKSFLEGRVPCKAPRTCSLTIKVTNGRVELAGIIHPDYRSELGRIKANVRGVASVSLVGVKVSSSK
jgi:osmotically-inducible protein OsmY